MFTETLEKFWKARFFLGIADEEGLLRLPNPAGRIALDRRFAAGGLFAWKMSFEDMKAHDVANRVVEDQAKEIEINNRVKPRGKIVEERGEVALLRDGLANLQQGFELTTGVVQRGSERHFRRRNDGVRHRKQDNTRVGGGSTKREQS